MHFTSDLGDDKGLFINSMHDMKQEGIGNITKFQNKKDSDQLI